MDRRLVVARGRLAPSPRGDCRSGVTRRNRSDSNPPSGEGGRDHGSFARPHTGPDSWATGPIGDCAPTLHWTRFALAPRSCCKGMVHRDRADRCTVLPAGRIWQSLTPSPKTEWSRARLPNISSPNSNTFNGPAITSLTISSSNFGGTSRNTRPISYLTLVTPAVPGCR
jgi:hypothetical protein